MRHALALAVSAVALLTATACNGQDASNGEAAARAASGQPVESRPPNGAGQTPAFDGQTRAPGVVTEQAIQVTTVAEGLDHPWALQELPDGRWLITERSGALRLFGADGASVGTVSGLPQMVTEGQAGLLDVAISPDFATDRLVYLSYSEPRDGGNGTAVGRGRLSDDGRSLEAFEAIFQALPAYDNTMHYGSRLVFDREGLEQPAYYWDPVIAPGGVAFYEGAMFPEWQGNLFVSGLSSKHLARLVIEGDRVVGEERLLIDQNQRIRDVQVARDGSVWVVTDEDNGRLLRITPAA